MTADVDHVLLTRFNLPSAGAESYIRAREGWLSHRVALFERYCLPSVRAQTSQAFQWIIYFDPESPEWLKERVRDHAATGTYVPVFRTSVCQAELVADITRVTGGASRYLITTNLDNDDGLAVNFVQRLQAVEAGPDRTAVYVSRGLVKHESRLYLRIDRRNAFGSVIESWNSPSTCWSTWHTLLGKNMRVLELQDEPGWLQVVHGANVSNRVRGRFVRPAAYATLFPGLLDDVRAAGLIEMAYDSAIAQPSRLARESCRSLVKGIAMNLVGKEGLDRAKTCWAWTRHRYARR